MFPLIEMLRNITSCDSYLMDETLGMLASDRESVRRLRNVPVSSVAPTLC